MDGTADLDARSFEQLIRGKLPYKIDGGVILVNFERYPFLRVCNSSERGLGHQFKLFSS